MGMSAGRGVFLQQVSCVEVCVLAIIIEKSIFSKSEGFMFPGTNVRKFN
jgi:hypothetical protein